MTPFERFGIRHLSASSLNLWRDQPGLWALRYLAKVRDEDSAAIWRGTAVESGVEVWLRKRDRGAALQAAFDTFEANAQGEVSEDIDAERGVIGTYTLQACEALADAPGLLMTQARIEHWLDGIPVPLIGYVDFVLEDGSLFDLKTTKAIPSAPRPDHARQVALYMAARQEAGSLLYVSPKKHLTHPVPSEGLDILLTGLRMDALALQRFLARCRNTREAVQSLPMNLDHFKFGDATRAAALELCA